MTLLKIFISIVLICLYLQSSSNNESDSITNTNLSLKKVVVSQASIFAISYTSFYFLWYTDTEKTKFHWFDDRNEWQRMDKLGHSYGAYWLSHINSNLYKKTKLTSSKASIIGTSSAFLLMSSIEVMDGFADDWGASVWDLGANASGALLYLSQDLLWHRQKIYLKYSYFQSEYSAYRPNILGNSFAEKIIKDYNSINFWLSANIADILQLPNFPNWINIAIGYSADRMTGGHNNYIPIDNSIYISDSERVYQFMISPDIDFTKIKTNSQLIKSLLFCLNAFKLPGPAISYDSNQEIQILFR